MSFFDLHSVIYLLLKQKEISITYIRSSLVYFVPDIQILFFYF